MEVAASAIAFAQAVGVISVGIKKLRTMQQASAEFMDLLNQLSRFNAQAELLRRALQSLVDEGSDVSHLDIELIRSLQGDLSKIGEELDESVAGFIASSKGIDAEGRHRIRKLKWQKEQARLVKLRDRARELSIEMSSCLTAINMSQGIRQTAMVLNVQSFMEVSFGAIMSQLDRHENLLREGSRPSDNIMQSESQTLLTPGDIPTWESSSNEASVPDTGPSPAVTITSTLKPACPPNCRCQCHVTSQVWSPAWARDALGMLMFNYRSLPLLGMSRCNVPLCKASSESAFRLHYCFPRWAVARALQLSMSWGSLSDTGVSIFLKIPRILDGFHWVTFSELNPTGVVDDLRRRGMRPTDILADFGQTILTLTLEAKQWDRIDAFLQYGFDPTFIDMNGRSAVHWARQFELQGEIDSAPSNVQTTLRRISAIKLTEDRTTPLTLIHRFFRGKTSLSLEECIQAEPKHINTVDELGFAPLHWAAIKGNSEAVQTLIEAGANVDQQTSHDGSTPLIAGFAACRQPLSSTHECARLFLEPGASPHLVTKTGMTALHYAVMDNPELEEVMSTVHLLLSYGANPRARTTNRNEPLHFVTDIGSKEAIEKLVIFLIENGADLEALDKQCRTPFLTALATGSYTLAYVLVEAGADASATDLYGMDWLQSMTGIGPAVQSSRLLPLNRFPSTDPDAPSQNGFSAVDWLVLRFAAPSLWGRVPKWWAVDMVSLILAAREINWKDGLFLDKKTILEENGVHRRMAEWVAREKRLMGQDSHYGDLPCVTEDVDSWFKSDDDASTCWETASENQGGHDDQDVSESVEDERNASPSVLEG